jgi:hypothetical protein
MENCRWCGKSYNPNKSSSLNYRYRYCCLKCEKDGLEYESKQGGDIISNALGSIWKKEINQENTENELHKIHEKKETTSISEAAKKVFTFLFIMFFAVLLLIGPNVYATIGGVVLTIIAFIVLLAGRFD